MAEVPTAAAKPAGNHFLGRTLQSLRDAWRDLTEQARGMVGAAPAIRADLPSEDLAKVRQQMQDCLDGRGGEVSARARAAELGHTYLGLNSAGRQRFLKLLAGDFDLDRDKAVFVAQSFIAAGDEAQRREAAQRLRVALEAPRVKLLTQFNALRDGIKFLVDLRADILRWAKKDSALLSLESDLKHLLSGWFDIGFLELQRITWDSPAALLERLSVYEAVHAVRGWEDLKNRLDSDRRCFAFFHPRMPNEPLIFVEVALVNGLAFNIQALLDEKAPLGDPRKADTAIFYSISNAQKGLIGISFGGFLIKRVVDQLSAEFPQLGQFATLSPIPGFSTWLESRMAQPDLSATLRAAERKALGAALGVAPRDVSLKAILADPAWLKSAAIADAMSAPMLRLVAAYLLTAKRENGKALDSVAHFHLSNGARVERINWLADSSGRGIRQSFGMMVNYLYRTADIEANHEAYTGAGEVAASAAVRGLI
ncbi:MAG TPA: malonyl-CoA decarboxylase [Alphaproteobacteria bacterium]|nr:malonyl-CoA decarboxylase [Alphaproteobacteria bacterium]